MHLLRQFRPILGLNSLPPRAIARWGNSLTRRPMSLIRAPYGLLLFRPVCAPASSASPLVRRERTRVRPRRPRASFLASASNWQKSDLSIALCRPFGLHTGSGLRLFRFRSIRLRSRRAMCSHSLRAYARLFWAGSINRVGRAVARTQYRCSVLRLLSTRP